MFQRGVLELGTGIPVGGTGMEGAQMRGEGLLRGQPVLCVLTCRFQYTKGEHVNKPNHS